MSKGAVEIKVRDAEIVVTIIENGATLTDPVALDGVASMLHQFFEDVMRKVADNQPDPRQMEFDI